jgi:hypothetical protein
MRNIQISINIGFGETEEPVTEGDSVVRMDDGSFQLIIGHENEFNIDRLESALLQTNYPALRAFISEYLEKAAKKKPANNSN